MSVLTNGLRIMSVAQEWQTVVTGVIIILAVYADILRRSGARELKRQRQPATPAAEATASNDNRRGDTTCQQARLGLAARRLVAAPAALAPQETYIPLISKGFQHQFWQAVKAGAEQAAKDYKVKVTFEGPGDRGDGRQADRHALGRARQEPEGDRLRGARQQGGDPAAEEGAGREDPGRSPSTRASTATSR